jgi:glutathione peroxidase
VAVLCQSADSGFYALTATDASGQEVSLSTFRGVVLLIVNVASECGYTDGHYRDLVRLHRTYSPHGLFQILAFPCNQFGQQEPKSIKDIMQFASDVYGASFPIFEKVNVIGSDTAPVWKFLEDQTGRSPDWNFWKYLVDHRGNMIGAWGPWIGISEIESMIKTVIGVAQEDGWQNTMTASESRQIRQDF